MELTKEQCREIIARRIAQELKDGDVISLGIGLPTEVANYIPQGLQVYFQSENGMIGGGERDFDAPGNAHVTNAGGIATHLKELLFIKEYCMALTTLF